MIGWDYNKNVGNNLTVMSQTAYMPAITGRLIADIRAGLGIMHLSQPSEALKQVDGVFRPLQQRRHRKRF
jgi:hypothetical protein